MSRKDYIAIARSIREQYDRAEDSAVKIAIWEIVQDLCTVLKSDNSNFDRNRFISAAIG